MSTVGIALLGAGGHAREIAVSLERRSVDADHARSPFVGYFADWLPEHTRLALPDLILLGAIDELATTEFAYLVAVGSPQARREIAERVLDCSHRLISVIDPTAAVGHRIVVGNGVYVAASVAITVDASIGDHVHLNVRSSIHHDVTIGRFTTVGPSAVVCGAVTIGEAVEIGASATILPGVPIGAEAVVGAGAVVTQDVESGAVVVGVPARQIVRRS